MRMREDDDMFIVFAGDEDAERIKAFLESYDGCLTYLVTDAPHTINIRGPPLDDLMDEAMKDLIDPEGC